MFQVRLAEDHGAIGLILFPDPENLKGIKAARYPKSWEMPASAIVRGTIGAGNGDPLTPMYPAKGKGVLPRLVIFSEKIILRFFTKFYQIILMISWLD